MPFTRILKLFSLMLALCLLVSCAGQPSGTTTPSPTPDPSNTAQPSQAPASSTPAKTQQERLLEAVGKYIDALNEQERVCALFFATPEQLSGTGPVTSGSGALARGFEAFPVSGIILFAKNIQGHDQLTALISDMQDAGGGSLWIGTDEEGGQVSRLGSNDTVGVPKLPSMYALASNNEPDAVRKTLQELGEDMAALGFNLNFAPVADILTNPSNSVIGDRAFGGTPDVVSRYVTAAVEGFTKAGIASCLKHFPGHGDTQTDSHDGAVSVTHDLERLQSVELKPFAAGIAAGAPMVLTGHISAPEVTGDDLPATLSSVMITDILRGRLGFDGLVVTDSMQMKAITSRYDPGEAAVMALKAGGDIILMPEDLSLAVAGVHQALADGDLTQERIEASLTRIILQKVKQGLISLNI